MQNTKSSSLRTLTEWFHGKSQLSLTQSFSRNLTSRRYTKKSPTIMHRNFFLISWQKMSIFFASPFFVIIIQADTKIIILTKNHFLLVHEKEFMKSIKLESRSERGQSVGEKKVIVTRLHFAHREMLNSPRVFDK